MGAGERANVEGLSVARLSLPAVRRGKVRDTFEMPPGADGYPRLLLVASDRISAFDVVLPTLIPGKGRLLTEIAAFWLRWIEARGLCATHLLSTDASAIPGGAFGRADATARELLEGRVTIGRACRPLPVEFVVRGYLEGSGWREYERTGSVCGVALPAGLPRCAKLDEPIFTPATKAEAGAHDENIGFDRAARLCDRVAGTGACARLREVSIAIYTAAAAHAAERGLLLADTKFEFGLPLGPDGEPTGEDAILIDEALTPDSSRYWPADGYEPGRPQASFDKQYVREHLDARRRDGAWDGGKPGPALPAGVVQGTLERYREARDRLLG